MNPQEITIRYMGASWDVRFYYYPGTNRVIHSASLEPNDAPEFEILDICGSNFDAPDEFLEEFLYENYDKIKDIVWKDFKND